MKKMDKVADEDREERKKIYVIRLRRDRLLSIGRFITSVPFENFSRIYPTFGSADLTIPTFTTLSPSYSKLFQRVFNFADRWRFVRVIDILQSIYAVFRAWKFVSLPYSLNLQRNFEYYRCDVHLYVPRSPNMASTISSLFTIFTKLIRKTQTRNKIL